MDEPGPPTPNRSLIGVATDLQTKEEGLEAKDLKKETKPVQKAVIKAESKDIKD
jgi:hypothetical protein